MINTYSFDVFDTCLCRHCGEPRLMFDVLSLKVQKAMGEDCSEHLRQLFVAARANAGGRNLSEIYNHVAESFPIPFSVEQMSGLELETEREMLAPIVATRELVDSLRQKGNVLFISDMYLPSTFIKERLVEHGFFKEGDQLYVSDELGACKYDGSLYKLIHERQGIPYRHWHHYGDNRLGDYRIPRKLGIHAHHLHYDYLPYEEQWRKMPVLQYQYPAILAGVARATRLSSDAPEDQKAFVCNISAPLMVSWVLNIMQDASQRGIKRLYFCARDTHTEYLIARNLQSIFPGIEVRYLFISTKAMESEETLLLNYFKQVGLFSFDNVALVDSNSSGNTLIRLNSIAKKNNLSQLSGYYMMRCTPNISYLPSNNDLKSLNYQFFAPYLGFLTPSSVHRLYGIQAMYELILSLNYHKRTVGYEYHGNVLRPVFALDTDDEWSIRNGGLKQVKLNNDNLSTSFLRSLTATKLHHFSKEIHSQITIPLLEEYFDRPRKIYLNYLNRFLWWGKPFVGDIFGKEKGVWKRGSRFYCLPSFFSSPIIAILSDINLRFRLNQMLAWIKRK